MVLFDASDSPLEFFISQQTPFPNKLRGFDEVPDSHVDIGVCQYTFCR